MQIFTDATHRIAYATDASAYREIPLGVAYPQTEEDVRWLMNEAKRRNTCLIPRAGGTSIAGQVVGKGIVVDVSKYMNRVLRIDADKRLAVENTKAAIDKKLGETVVVTSEWNEAVEAFRVALVNAGVIEDTTPSVFEKGLTTITKALNKTVNNIYGKLGK